jgi:hypothetical protein
MLGHLVSNAALHIELKRTPSAPLAGYARSVAQHLWALLFKRAR